MEATQSTIVDEEQDNVKTITKTLLCVIIDLNFNAWLKNSITLKVKHANGKSRDVDMDSDDENGGFDLAKFNEILSKAFLFINAYLLQSATNEVVIYGSFSHEAIFLGSKPDDLANNKKSDAVSFKNYERFSTKLLSKIISLYKDEDFMERMAANTFGNFSKIGSALKKSNCFINSWKQNNSRVDTILNSRIMIFQASGDNNDDYNSMVNSIFACKKNSVMIDSIMYHEKDSILLQQCAYLTGGIYTRTLDSEEFINCLFMGNYLMDLKTRKSFNLLFQEELDLRASCSCCNDIIDFGYVCSNCLTLYCSKTEKKKESKCRSCQNVFCIEQINSS